MSKLSPWQSFKATLGLRLYAWYQIPLLGFVKPTIIELSDSKTVLKIPLNRRTKNHLGVMYFGALGIGAELAIALKAVNAIQKSGARIDFIFKDFEAKFLKRADGDVHFICDDGLAVTDLIEKAKASKDRFEGQFRSYAVVPSKDPQAPVAEFVLTLSVKNRS
jgi:hypothetical protein